MTSLEPVLFYITVYFIFIAIFWIINSIIAGFSLRNYSYRDFRDSFLWPISLSVFVGTILRFLYEKLKGK